MAEEKAKPLTHKDVLRLIEENGGTAKGLDLSGKHFQGGINFSGINLQEAILEECHLEGLQLSHAHFEGAFMSGAHLEDIRASGVHFENTELVGAHLERARLVAAHLEGAKFFDAHLEEATLVNTFLDRTQLSGAHLQSVKLNGAKFTTHTEIGSVDWGNYFLGEEKEGEKTGQGHFLGCAEDTYRRLKQWYQEHGIHDIAGNFFYREQEAKRKRIQNEIQQQRKEGKYKTILLPSLKLQGSVWTLLWAWIYRIICGYGERPRRPIILAASVVLGSAFTYFIIGFVWEWRAFWNSLYFSAVSFTALGYGSWVVISNDWIKGIGAFESFIGVFTMALFLITFIRKMTR
ncbi:pentapeptide repeat-containing protein [Chloroflexota bacterium]